MGNDEQVKHLQKQTQEYQSKSLKASKAGNFKTTIERLNEKLDSLKKLKNLFIKNGCELEANQVLCEELVTQGDISFAKFNIAVSQSKHGTGWDELQSARISYSSAASVASQLKLKSPTAINNLKKCINLIKQFPPQLFFSAEIKINRVECSICGKEIRECNHIPGRAYNGKLCVKVCKDLEFVGAALTPNPVDPRCRVVPLSVDYARGWFISEKALDSFKRKMKKSRIS